METQIHGERSVPSAILATARWVLYTNRSPLITAALTLQRPLPERAPNAGV